MSVRQFPVFGGGGSGGSGGPATVTFPLLAPPGSSAQYSFTSGGGLRGSSNGGVALMGVKGDALLVNADNSISIPGAVSVQGAATLAGGLTTTTLTAASGSFSGNLSVGGGLGVSGDIQAIGDLSAQKITARGELSAVGVASTGPISGTALTISGAATIASLSVQGTFKAGQIASDGPFLFPTTGAQQPGLALYDEPSTGLFGAPGGNLAVSLEGQTALVFTSDLGAAFKGTISAPSANLTALTAGSLSVTGTASLAALGVSGDSTLAGNLTVQGTTHLANLDIDQLSTDHDLSVGGNASVKGALSVAGATSLAGLTVTGGAALGDFSGGTGTLSTLHILGDGSSAYPPVLVAPLPMGGGSTKYTGVLDGDGNLSVSKTFYAGGSGSLAGGLTVGGATEIKGALTLDAGLSGQAASFAGSVSTAGDLTAQRLLFGGSTFTVVSQAPAGSLSGSVGDLAMLSSTGLLYLKTSGQNTTAGWVGVLTQASGSEFPLLAPDSPDPSDGSNSNYAPQFAFASDATTGMGRSSTFPFFISVGGSAQLSLDAYGNLQIFQTASVAGSVQVQGAVTANNGGNFSGGLNGDTLSVDADANIGGKLVAHQSLQVLGAVTVGGMSTFGDVVFAPKLILDGGQQVGQSALSTCKGTPEGQITGNAGDLVLVRDLAQVFIKSGGSGDNTGWQLVGPGGASSGGGTAPAFPLQAPNSAASAPSYGFSQGPMGITATGTNVLVGVTNGTVGWTLDASQNFSLAAGLSVAGAAQVQGATTLAGLTAQAINAVSLNLSNSLQVAGSSTVQDVGAASLTASGQVAAGNLTAATTVAAGGNTWRTASAVPADSVGSDGDFTTLTGASSPMVVRFGGHWRQLALVGDPAPARFPLQGPADSASAPNFAPSAGSAGSGMFSPGQDQLAFSTKGTQAAIVDSSQNWTFANGVSAGALSGTSLSVTGPASVTGAASFGGTMQVTGAVTLASSLSAASLTASGAVSAASASFSGALSSQTLSTSGDATIGGNLTVNGTVTYAGVQKAGYFQTSDGLVSAPAYAFQSETGLGMWRSAKNTLSFAAQGSNMLSLTNSQATFAGAASVAGTLSAAAVDTPTVRNSQGTLALQAGTTTVLSVASNSVGSTQPVSAPSFQLTTGGALTSSNDPRSAFPVSVSLTDPRGYGISSTSVPDYNTASTYTIFATGSGGITSGAYSPNGYAQGAPGYLYSFSGGGSGTSLYVYEASQGGKSGWVSVRTASQPVVPNYPVVGPAGSASAPTFAVGSASSGLFAGTDAQTHAFVGITNGGTAVARFTSFTANSLPVYVLGLGDPSSSSTSGAFVASAQAPSTGAPNALPGAFYAFLGGGPAATGWINESTSGTPSFAKILTTSSPVAPTYPFAAPADSASAPSYAWAGNTSTGFYLAGTNSIGFAVNGTSAGTIASSGAWTFAAAVTASQTLAVTGVATLSSTLSVTGATTLKAALSGTSAAFTGVVQLPTGTAAAPSLACAAATGSGLFFGGSSAYAPFIAQSGVGVAQWQTFSLGGNASYGMFLGPSGTSGGLITCSSAPSGNYSGSPAMLYQQPGGGPGASLWICEATSGSSSSAWAKVLTTSSTISPSFPLLAPSDSAAAPSYSWSGNAGTGLYLAGTNTLGFTTNGVKAATVSASQAWAFAGAVSVATTLGVTGNTTLSGTLTVTGTTAHQAAMTGTTGSFSGLLTASGGLNVTNGTTAAPGLYFGGATGTGLSGAADSNGAATVATTVAGVPVSWNTSYIGSNTNKRIYAMFVGNPTSLPSLGGLMASTASPVNAVGGDPGNLYTFAGGGAGNTLFVYEGTSSGTSAWAKVLTTGSNIQPTFPLQSSVLGSYSSGTPPAYGFAQSGYTTTGMYAAAEQSTGNPVVCFASNGAPVAYLQGQTVNSKSLTSLFFGDATNVPQGLGPGLRASLQTPVGNIGAYAGQAYLWPGGGAGQTLWVKESWSSSNATTGWAYAFTSGQAQIAAQTGSVAAPYYSFAGYASTGTTFVSDAGSGGVASVGFVTGGTVAGYFNVGSANSTPIYNLVLGNPTVNSSPYPGSIRVSAQLPNGNVIGAPGQLFINNTGGAGTVLWVKEVGTGTSSGWANVLTTGSSQPYVTLTQQSTGPNTISGKTLIWADANNLVRAGIYVNASSTPTLKQEIVATPYGATQTITQANNNSTIVTNGSSQYVLTLPASSSAIDLCYRFQNETASGVVIQAASGQLIYVGQAVTSATGGTLTTTTVGATIELFCRAGTNNWYARGPCGVWTTS